MALNDILIDVQANGSATGMSGKTVSTGVGDDLVEILATSARGEAAAIKNSTVNTGAGDDTITFIGTTAAACTAYGMRSTTLDTGDGANLVTVKAASAGGHALGAEAATLRGGSGADSFSIKASTIGSGTSVGLHTSTLDLKDGNNTLRIEALAVNNTATGMWKSNVYAGNGDDNIYVEGKTTGSGVARGLHYSSINAGDGANTVSIYAEAAKSDAYAIACDVVGGKDNDAITVAAKSLGGGTAKGLVCSTVDGKEGDNAISISAQSATGSAYAVDGGKVRAWAGNDSVIISAVSGGGGRAQGLHCSDVNVGDGHNTVSIFAESKTGEAWGIGCEVTSGSGDDKIDVTAKTSGTATAFGIYCSTINAGGGHNAVTLTAESAGGAAYAMHGGKVITGAGNDTVTVAAIAAGRAQGLYCSDIKVGDGDNVVSISAESQKGEAWGIGCEVTAGSGNDIISVTAKTAGSAGAFGVASSTVNAGAGHNNITIAAESARGAAYAMHGGKVITGAGNDNVEVSAISGGSGRAQALYCSDINVGDGNNFVSLLAQSQTGEAWGIGCEVTSGSGRDTVSIVAGTSGTATARGAYCSTINVGDGVNRVDISAASAGGHALGMEGSKLIGGNDNDTFNILAATVASGTSVGQHRGTIDMKDGNNDLYIEAKTVNNTATGVWQGKIYGGNQTLQLDPEFGTVTTGPSTDRFTIVGKAEGTGKAYGFDGCLIDMKNGTNYLNISALAASNDATALKGATVYGGNDYDDFTILAKSEGKGTAKGLDCSSIDVKNGTNLVSITAESQEGNAYGIACGVTGGKDRDIISVTAKSFGDGYAGAMVCSKIDAKDGENTITVHAESATGTAYAVDGGGVYSGSGNDVISITAKSGGAGRAQALHCTTVNAGDGDNSVTIQADSVGGKAYAVGCGVYTGSGNDTVTISAASGSSSAYGLYCSTAAVGNGDNIASISAVSGNSYAIAMESSRLEGGSGRDDFSILAQAGGNGDAVAVHSSTVHAKDGANSVAVKAVTQAGDATAMWSSNVYTGSGDDTISLIAQSVAGKAVVLDHSNVYAGDGNNNVTLSAASVTGTAYAIACDVIGGRNNDVFSISAQTGGTATAGALMAGTVDLKEGHNRLTLSASAVDGDAYAIKCGNVYGGNDAVGSDAFSITASVSGSGFATAVASGGVVDLKGGNDILTVHAHSDLTGKAVAVSGSIYGGDGHDVITAMATSNTAGTLPSVFQGGKIDGGNGNDDISLVTTGLLASGTAGRCANVYGGAGNDIVRLVYDGSAADINFTQFKQNLTLDGGSNAAVSHAKADGGMADLGDILALEHGYADASLLSKLASQVTVKNFEALMLDFNNGAAESIALDSMLDAVKNLFGKANSGMSSLVVKGDVADVLQAGGLHAVEQHSGVEVQGVSTDHFGNDITFTHYTINYQNEEFNLYLQTNVSIA